MFKALSPKGGGASGSFQDWDTNFPSLPPGWMTSSIKLQSQPLICRYVTHTKSGLTPPFLVETKQIKSNELTKSDRQKSDRILTLALDKFG